MKSKASICGLYFGLFLLFFGAVTAYGQRDEKHFRNISVDKGLSQSTVFSITQDTLGFIWMATKDGLNRYDGKRFVIYRPARCLLPNYFSNK